MVRLVAEQRPVSSASRADMGGSGRAAPPGHVRWRWGQVQDPEVAVYPDINKFGILFHILTTLLQLFLFSNAPKKLSPPRGSNPRPSDDSPGSDKSRRLFLLS